MYEGPSYLHVSGNELKTGTDHAREKFPHAYLDQEMLRDVVNSILKRLTDSGKSYYVDILRGILDQKGIPPDRRSAYKSAIAKIFALRRARNHKQHVPKQEEVPAEEHEPVIMSELGPLTPEEVENEIKLFGFDEDSIPLQE